MSGGHQGSRIAPTVQLKRWIPPTAGHVKINVDAVVSHGVGSVAVCVKRSPRGIHGIISFRY